MISVGLFSFLSLIYGVVSPETDGRIVVSRNDTSIEIYATLPAGQLPSWLDFDESLVADDDGRISFDQFRGDTNPLGNAVIAAVDARSAGAPMVLETMSFMLHPTEFETEFSTPWDAISTITFCSADPLYEAPSLSALNSFGGWIAFPDDAMAEVSIVFPQTGRDVLSFEVFEYVDGRPRPTYVVEIVDAGQLVLPAVPTR